MFDELRVINVEQRDEGSGETRLGTGGFSRTVFKGATIPPATESFSV